MSPIKQLLLGSAIGIGLGMLIALSVSWHEVIDPKPPASLVEQVSKTIVWEGMIRDQKVIIMQKDIERY